MTPAPSPPCSLCGKSGLVYMVEGKPFCPECMYSRHPPLEYEGPERRDRPASTPFTRRADDMSPGHRRPPRRK